VEKERKKRVSDSKIEVIYQIRPEHLNGAGRLFGGRLMEWIDEIAGLVAIRHAQSNVITAAVDNLKFLRGAFQGDLVVLIGRIAYVGSTSMEIRVDTYVESLDGTRQLINIAHLVLVAVDEEGRPRKVPGLIVETESEKAEWEGGLKRKEMRRRRKEEGF
jgi:acyl-CoA hydrolase